MPVTSCNKVDTGPIKMAEETVPLDTVFLTGDQNNITAQIATQIVQDDTAGAVSLFIGTTRDNFEGKRVLHLEYEAYEPMAIKEMKKICQQIREKWSVTKIAMIHKIGSCPVGQISVIIAVSSPHRAEAMQAVTFGIDTLKEKVPIWKKEVYEASSPVWKQNKINIDSTKE
eukprot:m.333216 g.333216  ORF g.333216 m.333216 type:complete len:171 (+) comp17099_c0_seq1:109-621(+)